LNSIMAANGSELSSAAKPYYQVFPLSAAPASAICYAALFHCEPEKLPMS
jgi:hypothetical protein